MKITANSWEKLKQELRQRCDELEEYQQHISEAYSRTGLRGLAVREAHLQEVINNLEEAYNQTDWFIEEE